jgi:phosphoglycerol transferase MdoB-like AlkP superfamily enzyme
MACEISTPTYSLDIVPTLSNLFGLEFDSRLLVGRDVFSDAEPLVLWNNYSWVTTEGKYDSATGTFYPNDGVTADENYISRINNIVANKLAFSGKVLDYDYYGILFDEEN